jgi:hypothetical protein
MPTLLGRRICEALFPGLAILPALDCLAGTEAHGPKQQFCHTEENIFRERYYDFNEQLA